MRYVLILMALSACANELPTECDYNEVLLPNGPCVSTKDDRPVKLGAYATVSHAATKATISPVEAIDTTSGPALKTGCNGRKCVSGSGRGNSEGNERSKQDND